MLTIRNGTLTINSGRLTVDGLLIEEGATLHNDAEVHTTTTVSNGNITGNGTLWAWWLTSEFIGGTIDAAQTVTYFGDRPKEHRFIQLQFGNIYVGLPSGQGSVIG